MMTSIKDSTPQQAAEKYMRIRLALFVSILATAFSPTTTQAALTILSWSAPTHNTDGTVIINQLGYIIAYGTTSGTYDTTIDVGAPTETTLAGLTDGQHYYAAVKAYNDLGEEGDFSGEIQWVQPDDDPPSIAPAGPVSVVADVNDQTTLPDLTGEVTVDDNVSSRSNIVITQAPSAGTTVGLGDTSVTVTATDEAGNTAQVTIVVSVNPMNRRPQVSAGTDQEICLPVNTVQLTGTATDDGYPQGNALTTQWTRVSGPGSVVFANASSASTMGTFSAPGTYVLRLTASDGELTATDDVTIVVLPKPRPLPPHNLHLRLIE